MLPKPIDVPDGLPFERLVRQLVGRGVTPEQARQEAARLIRARRDAEAGESVQRLTEGFSVGF